MINIFGRKFRMGTAGYFSKKRSKGHFGKKYYNPTNYKDKFPVGQKTWKFINKKEKK